MFLVFFAELHCFCSFATMTANFAILPTMKTYDIRVNMSRRLVPGSNLTYEWLENLLDAECSSRPAITDIGPLPGEILGMMSTLKRVSLKWDPDDHHLPQSVVLKLPSASGIEAVGNSGSDKMDEHADVLQNLMHNCEATAYQWLKKFSKKPLASPHVYIANKVDSGMPAIVLEDLGDAHLVQLTDGFTEKQLFSIIDELADFHAFSFRNHGWEKVGFSKEESDAMFSSFGKMLKDLMRQLRESMPGYWDCLAVFEEHSTDLQSVVTDYMRDYAASGKPLILAHGDLWCPQILWEKHTIAGIIDWQLAHPGSVVEDICRVLATSTKTELRRRLQKQLFDRYYERLKGKLEDHGAKVPFEREYLDIEYKSCLPYTIAMTTFATAMWANSNVLKKGDAQDQERIMETFSRTRAFIEDSLKVLGWT